MIGAIAPHMLIPTDTKNSDRPTVFNGMRIWYAMGAMEIMANGNLEEPGR